MEKWKDEHDDMKESSSIFSNIRLCQGLWVEAIENVALLTIQSSMEAWID